MQVVLVMFKGDGERRSFSIVKDLTVIGRREDCDFRIQLGEISRKHCKLLRDNGSLRVEDLGSSNGTFHNGARVQEAELQAGDTLQVGSVAFVVQIDGSPPDEDLAPVVASRSADGSLSGEFGSEPTTINTASGGNGAGNPSEFDPMTYLDESDDSGGNPAVTDSQIAEDISADPEQLSGDNPA
ncbi:MAG: FHA domain-containing protein [Tepidisphaeraceae bacterium]